MELSKTMYEGFVISGDPRFPALKLIKCEGQGSVPKLLRGVYTSVKSATDHIDLVLKDIAQEAASKKAASKAAAELVAANRKIKAEQKKQLKAEREADAAKDKSTSGSEQVLSGTDNGSVAA